MTAPHWLVSSLGSRRVEDALTESSRRRLVSALDVVSAPMAADADALRAFHALELAVFDLLNDEERLAELRDISANAFQIARTIQHPSEPLESGKWLVRVGALAVLGNRSADFRRSLMKSGIPDLPLAASAWGTRVRATILDLWLRLLRRDGWTDLDAVQRRVVDLREAQRSYEPEYLRLAEERKDVAPAWELVCLYHLAKAAEVLAVFISQGASDGRYDVLQQLEAQFDRARDAAARSESMTLENLARVLTRASIDLVENSIWAVTRAVNSRVTKFVKEVTSRSRKHPIFEMLPPQRKTLREEGLLGSSHRSVVVSLPTSSGKTLIAQFRILQALNQFDLDRGWVAYVAPTRALVNQLATRLRRDFGPLQIVVEKVSPALEVDGLEAAMLSDAEPASQFRVLITTPEKLDLLLRGGWEQKIGRPLTLVVVDEAHGLGSGERGLKLELLLATINRECKEAQFLLLTPFVTNASEIAQWLAPDRNKNIELSLDWSPNDRVIAIAQPVAGENRGDYSLSLTTVHTSKSTLSVPETLAVGGNRPLGFSWSTVSRSPGKLAAATAALLRTHGPVIVLAAKPQHTWGIAEALRPANGAHQASPEAEIVKTFLAHEMGRDFPLCDLLDHGVAVHHGGMSEDSRALVEWLTENGKIGVLVATTTIAHGVNFPVSGIVMAAHQYPWGQDMPPEDFWNIAGRAGRVDQEDLGVIALAATDDMKARALENFVSRSVGALNSTLVEMVQLAAQQGALLDLSALSWRTEWSSFLQYLAHTYRQMGDHQRFAAEVEQVLRGTLGFRTLRKSHPTWASQLVQGVHLYAQNLKGKPLKLVDATGFSWETVNATLGRLADEHINRDSWGPELFGARREPLQRMMGILLSVPELRDQLKEVTGGPTPDGVLLARMICDWVQGRSLDEMARKYFLKRDADSADRVEAMTRCCKSVFGRLTQTASWGLAALQSLSIADGFDEMPPSEQRMLRNLPARVYYGVNSDEAVALRLIGVPRMAAQPLVGEIGVKPGEALSALRKRLREKGPSIWTAAMGAPGVAFHRAWAIIEGED